MELRRIWVLIWHRKLLISLLVIAAVIAGYETVPRTPRYEATAVLFVGVPEYNSYGVFSNDIQLGQQEVAGTFATMLPSLGIAETAVQATRVPRSPAQVLGEIRATILPGTTLIHASVIDTDPVVAQQLANAIADAFVDQILKIDPVTQTASGVHIAPRSPISVSQRAVVPGAPVSNGMIRTMVLSFAFGLLAAIGVVLLLDYLDLSVRSPEDLERRIGLPVLGIIPLYPQLSDREVAMAAAAPTPAPRLVGDLDG